MTFRAANINKLRRGRRCSEGKAETSGFRAFFYYHFSIGNGGKNSPVSFIVGA